MKSVPLKSLADLRVSNVDKKSLDGEVAVRLCNYVDVYYHDRITADLPFMQATATRDQIKAFGLRAGDVLFTKDSETADDIAIPAYVPEDLSGVVCGYHLTVARPTSGTDGRFLFWALSSQTAREQFTVAATGVTRYGLRYDEMGGVRVPLWPIGHQRAIADFLDRETARIDALIAAKRRMIEVMRERRQVTIDESMTAPGRARVRHLVGRVTSGPRGWAEHVAESGQPFLRIANVSATDIELDLTDLIFVQPPDGAERQRTMVAEGDVLVSITAEIGSVGLARAGQNGAAVSQHIALLTPTGCSGEWLAYSLVTSAAKAQLDAGRYGGTKTQLSLDDVRDVVVGVVPPEAEVIALAQLRSRLDRISHGQRILLRQINLLVEHRQALITASVTGEIEVPGVAA